MSKGFTYYYLHEFIDKTFHPQNLSDENLQAAEDNEDSELFRETGGKD